MGDGKFEDSCYLKLVADTLSTVRMFNGDNGGALEPVEPIRITSVEQARELLGEGLDAFYATPSVELTVVPSSTAATVDPYQRHREREASGELDAIARQRFDREREARMRRGEENLAAFGRHYDGLRFEERRKSREVEHPWNCDDAKYEVTG